MTSRFAEPAPTEPVVQLLTGNQGNWSGAGDRETLLAILATERVPRARVFLADGRRVKNAMLRAYAEEWDVVVR